MQKSGEDINNFEGFKLKRYSKIFHLNLHKISTQKVCLVDRICHSLGIPIYSRPVSDIVNYGQTWNHCNLHFGLP